MKPKFFATTNKNKLSEASQILGYDLEQIAIELLEPQAVDVEEVVKVKAEDAFHKTGKIVLVEDTGLEFSAWGKMPGALIKWFMDEVGNEGLLKMLSSETDRRATAKTAVAFFDGTKSQVFTGSVMGTIPEKICGSDGFGWDPIFVPDGETKSFAEMSDTEKNSISMRKLAFDKMRERLK
jgi:XTP/dITP diphosphohydrolase